MNLTPLIEFQSLEPMNIPRYFKTTKVAEFLNETIGKGKTNKETSELLNISPSTINRYKKLIGITLERLNIQTGSKSTKAKDKK